ncbi:MAG: ribosomal-processing cysteine protease Prp [Acholeplasmataceae bacterium]|nr:MAG: ribosomal-processing cysteine protease Prp [Acholeplasmataceae bacterium]
MIESTFAYRDGHLDVITVTGHAQAKAYGKDIVCAGASTAIIITVNALEQLGLDAKVVSSVEEGHFKLKVKTIDPVVDGLLRNLEHAFIDLYRQYPDFVRYRKEE